MAFLNPFMGLRMAKNIREGREEDARKAKGSKLASEADKLLEKYPSKSIRLPSSHIDYPTEHNSTLRDFVVEHKEAGVKAVICHVLDNGTELPKDVKEKITDFFVDDYKKKISHSATVTDFFHCFTEASVGDVVGRHLPELPAGDPKRSVIGTVAYHPEEFVGAVRKMINFYPHLRGLIPETPKK